jgi:hypothetical protein
MNRKVLLGVAAVIAFIALLTYMTMGMKQHRVEVCMEFMGRKNCAIAAGPTREQALRTAAETACATISSGMTESTTCGRTPPVSTRWLQ